MALARLSVLKSLVGVSISNTTYDDVMKNYLAASTDAFQSDCDTRLEKDTYSEYYTINKEGVLSYAYIKHLPVVSIYKVSTTGGLISASKYSIRNGNQLYCTTGFTGGRDCLYLSYSAGYDTSDWYSLGLYDNSIISYTGYTSINNGIVSIVTSFPSSEAIKKASIATGDPSLVIWQWTVSSATLVNWQVPRDIEQVIAEDAAIQLLKIKPSDTALSAIGEGRIGIVKINRGLYKGATDQTEFEKYVEGFTGRWKRCVTKYRSLWYG